MNLQLLNESPINEDFISAEVFLGYVAKMALEKIKGIEHSFAMHLISETAERMLRLTPQQAESIYETRIHLLYKEKDGFIALLQWFFSKSRMRRKRTEQPIRLNDLASIQLTEKQAMGYLLLAASGLDFLTAQIQVFEIETHLLMRTTSQQEARSKLNQFYK